ncbi:MAG: HEAT repeat domain-containing protein [Deltaproteobacteria bacterium]
MLSSSNSMARAYAIQEIAKRGDPAVETELIRLLNDSSPVQLSEGLKQTRVAELAKTALVHIMRLRIWQAPDNIGLLVPYLKAAITGGLGERQAIIEILGELKEPMARQSLVKMASDPNPLIRQAVADALAKLELEKPRFMNSVMRRKIELTLTACLVIMTGCALWAGVTFKFDRAHLRTSLLSVIPVVLLAWIVSLIVLDFSIGVADERAIDSATTQRDIVALKAMNYQHITYYPGDSYVAQCLVKKGTEDTVHCLTHLLDAAPDDIPGYTKILSDRSRWILSRIIGIIQTLTRLTNDRDEEVRKKATEALAKAARSPVL